MTLENKSIVEANGEAYFATYVPDNSFSGLRFFNSTALKGFIDYYHGTQGDAMVYSATGYHKFITSGTEKVRIINNGNVGIGTDDPLGKLHVYTASSGATANTNADDFIIESNTNAGISILGDGNETQYIMFGDVANSAIGRITYNHTDNNMSLYTNGSERMRITSAGGISFGSTGTAYGTSGQILKSNGDASPTWIDGSAIPGVPAGSGTLNTVAMWTPDGDTLGNSIITQPSTSTIDVDGNILISDTGNDKYFGSNVNLILNADADSQSGDSARNIIFSK